MDIDNVAAALGIDAETIDRAFEGDHRDPGPDAPGTGDADPHERNRP